MEHDEANILIQLVSCDGEIEKVWKPVATLSNLIRDMLEHCTDTETTTINLPNINGTTLHWVVGWCRRHFRDYAPSTEDKTASEDFPTPEYVPNEKDKSAIRKLKLRSLINVTNAANYLDIEPLLTLCVWGLANLIKGHSPEQIFKNFELDQDVLKEGKKNITEKFISTDISSYIFNRSEEQAGTSLWMQDICGSLQNVKFGDSSRGKK